LKIVQEYTNKTKREKERKAVMLGAQIFSDTINFPLTKLRQKGVVMLDK